VVGLGETGAGHGDSSGAQGVEGGRGEGLIWDHAAFYKAKAVGEGGCVGYINRPMLLSPAERVFAEVRQWVEGRRYERIEAKKPAGEEVPRGLEAEGKVARW